MVGYRSRTTRGEGDALLLDKVSLADLNSSESIVEGCLLSKDFRRSEIGESCTSTLGESLDSPVLVRVRLFYLPDISGELSGKKANPPNFGESKLFLSLCVFTSASFFSSKISFLVVFGKVER